MHVCPTGIDIRNGTQLECVNCTACIDACDSIMDRVGFDRGLIRYASEEQIAEGKEFHFTTRSIAYSVVLVLIVGLLTSLLAMRTEVETSILRTPGMLYQEQENNKVSNLYNIKIINKTNEAMPINLKLMDESGTIKMVGNEELMVTEQGVVESALFLIYDRSDVEQMKTPVTIGVYSEGELIEEVDTYFLGPDN